MRALVVAFALWLGAAPVSAQDGTASLPVLVRGSDAHRRVAERVAQRTVITRAHLVPADLPVASAEDAAMPAIERAVTEARALYTSAEFDRCLEALSGEGALESALANGRRSAAAQLLLWRTACAVGAGDDGAAAREADRLAELGLDLPATVSYAAPEVDAVLALALRRADEAPRTPVVIHSTPAGAFVHIDGRTSSCRTPCEVTLPAGTHHASVRHLGYSASNAVLAIGQGSPARFDFDLDEATPEEASAQWARELALATSIDGELSLRLLSRALRARRFIVIDVVAESQQVDVRGAIDVDGSIARAERRASAAELEDAVEDVVRELLFDANLAIQPPSLLEEPLFWVGVTGAVALSVAATLLLTADPDVATKVTLE